MPPEPLRGVLVDFDGTLVPRDTTAGLLVFLARRSPPRALAVLAWGLLAALPWRLGQGRRALLSVALWLLTVGLGRRRIGRLLWVYGRRVAEDPRDRPFAEMVQRLRAHRERGDRIWIVSGSSAAWIRPVLRRHGVPCDQIVGSRLRLWAGGLVMSTRAVGRAKPRLVRLALRGVPMRWVAGYGNEASDGPMLGLAHRAWMVSPAPPTGARVRPAHVRPA